MPAIARAFIFLAIGAGLQAIVGFAVLPALFGGVSTTTLVLATIGTLWGAAYGFLTGIKGVYALDTAEALTSVPLFVVDTSWSAINTITGHFFMIYCAVKGTLVDPVPRSQASGMIHFSDAALPGADATTIGNVIGGTWMKHELVHTQQARIFGPFYWFVYLLGYVVNFFAMLVKWLATGQFKLPYIAPVTGERQASIVWVHWEAYGRVVMEDWAYHAAPDETIRVGPYLLWLLLALVNAVGVFLIFGAIGPMGVAAGLIGLAILVVYATIRAFFDKAQG